jgi:hypothetical protein
LIGDAATLGGHDEHRMARSPAAGALPSPEHRALSASSTAIRSRAQLSQSTRSRKQHGKLWWTRRESNP